MRCSAEAGAPSGLRAAPRGLGGAAPANARTNALTESLAASEHADEVHEGQSLSIAGQRRACSGPGWASAESVCVFVPIAAPCRQAVEAARMAEVEAEDVAKAEAGACDANRQPNGKHCRTLHSSMDFLLSRRRIGDRSSWLMA